MWHARKRFPVEAVLVYKIDAKERERDSMNEIKSEMSEWQLRINPAAKALGLAFAELESKLKEGMGVTSVEMIDDDDVFKFGDFREAFKERPIAVLRMAFKCLRGGCGEKKVELTGTGDDERTQQLKALGLKVRIEDADPATLLKLYLPDKPSDPVSTALKKRFQDRPVLAFRDDGTLALQETLQNIADMEQGFPAVDAIMVDGKLAKLYPIGIKPETMVDEDPLFEGQPLRNGCSIVNSRNWTKVPLEARQLCRIIAKRGDIDVDNRDAVLRLLERATPAGSEPGIPGPLTEAYPEAYLDWRTLEKRGELPKLKVALGSLVKPNNPFGVPRRY